LKEQSLAKKKRPILGYLANLDMVQCSCKKNGIGFLYLSLFWESNVRQEGVVVDNLSGELARCLIKSCNMGSFESFKDAFALKQAATEIWFWLVHWLCGSIKEEKWNMLYSKTKTKSNLPGTGCGGSPIWLGCIWEHAYYII